MSDKVLCRSCEYFDYILPTGYCCDDGKRSLTYGQEACEHFRYINGTWLLLVPHSAEALLYCGMDDDTRCLYQRQAQEYLKQERKKAKLEILEEMLDSEILIFNPNDNSFVKSKVLKEKIEKLKQELGE